jgi:RNA polymerase sigma-70 factor (ECF subfamily)
MTGHEQDAEDVVQETLLRAFRNIHRYESRACFSTWLHRIAANCSLDVIRKRTRRREDEEHPLATETRPSPERLTMSAEIQTMLARGMDELSEQERTAFVLRHFENQSIPEIAGALGVSLVAAKHSVFRAVQKLRQTLEPVVGSQS